MRSRLGYFFLVAMLTLLSGWQTVAAETPRPVTIGIVADNEPYSSYGQNGAEGFSVDVLNKVSELTGIPFEYRVGSWTNIYTAFLRNEIDVIDEVSWREDRVQNMLFTRPYHIRQTVIMRDANREIPEIKTLDDLKGLRVGVLRDVYYLQSLRSAGLDLTEYSLQPEMIHALSFGWVDVVIGSEVTLSYFARQLGQLNLISSGPAPLKGQESEDFRIAVQKNAPELHARLDNALAQIDSAWLQETQEKWQEFGGQKLQTSQLQLTHAEKNLIRRQGPLRVGLMRDYSPFSFEDSGRIQGLTVDTMTRVMDLTGLRAVPVVGQWSQLIDLFRRGEIDVMADMSDLPSRRSFSRLTDPYHFISVVGFTKSANYRLKSKEDLKGLKVGLATGIFYEDTLRREIGENAITFDDQASMFVALANNQVDLVLAALDIGNRLVREQGLRDIHIAGELVLNDIVREDLRFGLRPELEGLIPIFNQALGSITPTERRVIENRWLGAQISARTHNTAALVLTEAEQKFLESRQHKLVFCAHEDWMPLEGIGPRGEHLGVAAGVLQHLSQKLGIETVLYPTSSWKRALDALAAQRCDLMAAATKENSLQNPSDLHHSRSYYAVPNVVLSRIESPFIDTLSDLGTHPIGISPDFGLYDALRQRHPTLNLIPVTSETEGLRKVQSGDLYGYIGTLTSTNQQLQDLRLANIRVIGRVPMDTTLAIATPKTETLLAGILQKALTSMTNADLKEIEAQWRAVQLKEQVDYTLVWQVVLGTLFILALFLVWNRKLSALNRKLAIANEQLARMSTTDTLTGLGNRSRFEQTFQHSFQYCQRTSTPFMVAMVDADHFKEINDTYGHAGGDTCLKTLAETLRSHFQRSTDQVIRFGGEEFVVFSPVESASEARTVLESLREKIKLLDIPFESRTIKVTISIGFHVETPGIGSVPTRWLQSADDMLYKAKNSGRNCVKGNDTGD